MSEGVSKKKPLWKWVKRSVLVGFVVSLIALFVGWLFLPRIAERVIRGLVAEAGLEGAELTVNEVGWRSAVIEDVSFAGDSWSVSAERVNLFYDANDLAAGRMEEVVIEGLEIEVDLEPESEISTSSSGAGEASPATNPYVWLHQLVGHGEKVGKVVAEKAKVDFRRGNNHVTQVMDLSVGHGAFGKLSAEVETKDYRLDVSLVNSGEESEVTVLGFDIKPLPFVGLIEFLSGVEEPLIPDGFGLPSAELTAKVRVDGDRLSPIDVTGTLARVSYDGGEKPIRMKSHPVSMQLEMNAGGGGFVRFAGAAGELDLPLDPSSEFELGLVEGSRPKWSVNIAWGDEPTLITGKVEGASMFGRYDGKPIGFSDLGLDFRMAEQKLMVGGGLMHAGTRIPLRYTQTMEDVGDGKWVLGGEAVLGTIDHTRPLPVLDAVSGLFEDVKLTGKSKTRFVFSLGSHEPFRGVMTTRLSDVLLDVVDGKLKAQKVSGTWELHLLPLPDADPDTEDPSYYTVDFSVGKLAVASKDALDFDLVHEAENPLRVTGKGKFGESGASLVGEVKEMTLYGEKGGHELVLADTAVSFEMNGDVLAAKGSASLGENTISFSYRHELKSSDDGWELDGVFRIQDAKLDEPVANAVMFVDAMEGKTLSGRVAMKLDFSLGSDEDFDGVLGAAITGGTLTFEDDGPVLEGLRGDIRISSMKNKQTEEYHRVTAAKVRAFDMEMRNLRLDYKMLPDGNIPLKNIAVSALGGQIWVDPFVLPEGDGNYEFKLRMKRLDLAELAQLFPDFNGSISGRIDGLLPIQSINGDFRPVRGGMYLTPRSRAKLRYDAGNKFSGGIDPKSEEYRKMKMVEDSLRNLELRVLSIRMFDPQDGDKAVVLKLRGQAPSVPGSPPIHLNINGFKPDDDTLDFFDLLLKHRDKLNFGL